MVIVAVEVLDDASVILTVAGLKVADAPAGNPLADRLITPVKPASGVTVTVYWAALPDPETVHTLPSIVSPRVLSISCAK